MQVKSKKRILFVAAEFPPHKTIGRIRTVKFCLHLQKLGWDCFVLTLPDTASPTFDAQTLNEVPAEVKVFRAAPWKFEEKLIDLAKQAFKKTSVNGTAFVESKSFSPQPSLATTPASAKSSQIKKRLIFAKSAYDRFIYRNFLIPDGLIGWLIPALNLGKKVCREYNVDLIFATAPPFTDLLVGRFLSSATGIPWVADYRDLWTGDVLREWVPNWRKKIEIALEKRVLAKAARIIAVSEPKTEVLKRRINRAASEYFSTITNGYDPEEYQGYFYQQNGVDKVRMVYTGRLFKNRRGYELIQAAGELFEKQRNLKSRLQVEYYGGISPEIKKRIDEMLCQYELVDQFKFFPDVSYERSKALQAGADVLLLIVDTGETTSGVIPGKLFEYVAARRPILCIAAPGATPEIIENGRLGWVVSPSDIEALKNLLKGLLSNFKAIDFAPNEAYLVQFDRKKLAKRLNEILIGVLNRGSA